MSDLAKLTPVDPEISDDRLRKAEAYIEAEEGALNRLAGFAGNAVMTVAVVMSLFHLYAAIGGAWPFQDLPIISTQPLRYTHVAFVLLLSFLLFPAAARFRNRIRWWDIVLGVTGACARASCLAQHSPPSLCRCSSKATRKCPSPHGARRGAF